MPASLKANKSALQLRTAFHAETVSALEDMGKYVQAMAAKYPKQSPNTTYTRTGTLGRTIAVGKVQHGGGTYRIQVGTNVPYAPHVEYGTGIYGKSGQPITPKNGKFLSWIATRGRLEKAGQVGHLMIAGGMVRRKGKLRASPKHDTMRVFVRSVKGMKGWFYMKNAMTSPRTTAYMKARLNLLINRLNAQI